MGFQSIQRVEVLKYVANILQNNYKYLDHFYKNHLLEVAINIFVPEQLSSEISFFFEILISVTC
jgi:hypothetical protein